MLSIRTLLMPTCAFVFAALSLVTGAQAASFAPATVTDSTLTLRADPVATPFVASGGNNLGSPVVVDGALHFINQRGEILREIAQSDSFATVLDADNLPEGVTPSSAEPVVNIAEGPDDSVIVVLTSSTVPSGFDTVARMPDVEPYPDTPDYQLVYRYQRESGGRLTNPTELAAFEAGGHRGGGLLALDNGDVLFATGDGLPFGLDGRAAPQDDDSHLSKILRIDGRTGAVIPVAKGVRNAQRLTWADSDRTTVAFADIGGVVAEEVNTVPLAQLLDTQEIENFGWGRNPDGKAREGTFYVEEGSPRAPGSPAAVGVAPLGEAGFLQPYAQWGREDLGFAAASGPVFSPVSFVDIRALFGDLVSGRLFATLVPPGTGLAEVVRVNVVDEAGQATSLLELAGTSRADPRFFNFADGTAGVLLERSGKVFRLTETSIPPVPLPAGLILLMTGLSALSVARRRVESAAR